MEPLLTPSLGPNQQRQSPAADGCKTSN